MSRGPRHGVKSHDCAKEVPPPRTKRGMAPSVARVAPGPSPLEFTTESPCDDVNAAVAGLAVSKR